MRPFLLRREAITPSVLFAALTAILIASPCWGAEFLIDPQATYLRRGTGEFLGSITSDVPVIDPVPIDLLGLGYTPGMSIIIEQLGDWSNSEGGTDDIRRTIGVFSSDNAIITGDPDSPGPDAFDTVDRISSAIPAGSPFVTQNTFFGDLTTDIPADFLVSSNDVHAIGITIPNGARYLWISALDTNYRDNSDPNRNYRVRVTVAPEPSAGAFLPFGLPALALLRRRRNA
jgi:hypothetical protein